MIKSLFLHFYGNCQRFIVITSVVAMLFAGFAHPAFSGKSENMVPVISMLLRGQSYFPALADFTLPQQDQHGWTILSPSSDSRLIYVHASLGNDSTAQFYGPGDSVIGPDPINPTGPVAAFETIAAARSQMRDDKPDWMLLARGEHWEENLTVIRGRSADERAVYCAYGSGQRPELRTGNSKGIQNSQMSNVIIASLRFWAHTRDDESGYFTGYSGSQGFNVYTRDDTFIRDVLIEDCVFRSYTSNVISGHGTNNRYPVQRFILRRSHISQNYSTEAHSQGLYYTGEGPTLGAAILLEENFFDHNGWRIQRYDMSGMHKTNGQATMFNHNTYFANAKGVLFKGNIFLRGSSMGNKWTANNGSASATNINLVDNIYIDGEIGISIGGNNPGSYRFKDVTIHNNVFTKIGESQPTNRSLGWGIDALDWDGGKISNNLLLHNTNANVTNVYAIHTAAESAARHVEVTNNIMYGLAGGQSAGSGLIRVNDPANTSNISFSFNHIHNADLASLISIGSSLGGYRFANNKYASSRGQSQWFGINGSWTSFSDWKTTIDSNASTFNSSVWPDPDRDIEGYVNHLGKGTTYQDFIDSIALQSKENWDTNLIAPAINNWIRAGFGR